MVRTELRELSLAMHHTLDHIAVIVCAVVEQYGAVPIRPVISEVALLKES